MTKKDYEKFAAMMVKERPAMRYGPELVLWGRLAIAMADIFEEDNERFDRERFLDATLKGLGEAKI